MSTKLSKDMEELVLTNLGLVHYVIRRNLNVSRKSPYYQELVSIGNLALVEAAINFDSSRNTEFSSCATAFIRNQIFRFWRENKKYSDDISIYKPVAISRKGLELRLIDTIVDFKSDFSEWIIDKENFVHIMNIILNCLEGKEKIAIFYKMGNLKQKEIAKKMNTTQSNVSRTTIQAIKKIKRTIEMKIHYKKVFSTTIENEGYRISFSSKDIRKFNSIFANFSKNVSLVQGLPYFKIKQNGDEIVIQLSVCYESFLLIAKLIWEIENFNMSLTYDKKVIEDYNVIALNGAEKTSRNIQLEKYILSKEDFATSELIAHFPEFPVSTINACVHRFKKKGMISSISRGKYYVNCINFDKEVI